MDNNRNLPRSIEDLVIKRKQEEEQLLKPKFLSKEEREKIALERRQKDVEAKRKREQDQLTDMKSRFSSASIEKKEASSTVVYSNEITRRFLGTDEKPKKKLKPNDKKRVKFDWDNTEDTSTGEVLTKRPSILFGKGSVAGIDEQEQIKARSEFYDSMLKNRDIDSSRVVQLKTFEKDLETKLFKEDVHWSKKQPNEMKERDWRILKEDFGISTKGSNLPHPLRYWSEAEFPEKIKNIISAIGYKEPTPIQRQAIPIQIANRDIIGIAETGSGKTASFLIPMLVYIMDLPRITEQTANLGPYSLILAPTRELAQQIEQEALKFCSRLNYRCISLVGGHSLDEQAFNLRNGTEIVIATPGRLVDILDRRIMVLEQCTFVVMDEADRMIDMGFEADVNTILDSLPVSNIKPDNEDAENTDILRQRMNISRKFRQTVMFSATMPPEVMKLARKYLRRPAVVTIGTAGQAVDRIEQRVEIVGDESRKRNRLLEILNSGNFQPPMVIFVNLKGRCDTVARTVQQTGYRTAILHGGKNQEQREAALYSVKSGNKDVLVATDVAGRGIDIKNVSVVINFDMAKSIEDYTHRIGRTGRAGKTGIAITFLGPDDEPLYFDLKQMLSKSPVSKIPRELLKHEAAQSKAKSLQAKKKLEDAYKKSLK